ncbi:hypothetical protein STEG23_021879, partial [Scotinomys teguina]
MTTARYRPTWDLALDPLVSCKLCLGEYPAEQMTTIAQCQCIFCTLCLKQYVELLIKEGLETAISCPDAACPKKGHLQENEIECMVAAEIMQRYKKLQFEREVLFDPCRTWCPASTCQAVCQLKDIGLQTPQLVQCKACDMEFCSACKARWHPGQGCPETMPITFLPGETSSAFKMEEGDAPIKRCPKCRVYIERDEGCAQMMCKNCKHAFCWYCLESLDDDFLLIHYDKGPCRNKLGHSRASVIWHRTQVAANAFEYLQSRCFTLNDCFDSLPHFSGQAVQASAVPTSLPPAKTCFCRSSRDQHISLSSVLAAPLLIRKDSCARSLLAVMQQRRVQIRRSALEAPSRHLSFQFDNNNEIVVLCVTLRTVMRYKSDMFSTEACFVNIFHL